MDYRHSHFHFEAKHIGDKTVLIASYCKFSFFLWLPFSLEVLVFCQLRGEKNDEKLEDLLVQQVFVADTQLSSLPF